MNRRVLIYLSLALLACSGCTNWPGANGKGPSPWTEGWRERARSVKSVGINEEAREIERNLGVY